MKPLMTIMLLVISLSLRGQQEVQPTDSLVVTGEVVNELYIGFDEIEQFAAQAIGDVVITNHLGEPRGAASNLSGVLIKALLKDLALTETSPKLLSEFYFGFVASDIYKVVYSWNEIFNSPTGNNLYLITSRDGQGLRDMEERLLILTPTDFKTGRRHIKGTSKIIVKRVE